MRHHLHAYTFSVREQTLLVILIEALLLYEMALGTDINGVHTNKLGNMIFLSSISLVEMHLAPMSSPNSQI